MTGDVTLSILSSDVQRANIVSVLNLYGFYVWPRVVNINYEFVQPLQNDSLLIIQPTVQILTNNV